MTAIECTRRQRQQWDSENNMYWSFLYDRVHSNNLLGLHDDDHVQNQTLKQLCETHIARIKQTSIISPLCKYAYTALFTFLESRIKHLGELQTTQIVIHL